MGYNDGIVVGTKILVDYMANFISSQLKQLISASVPLRAKERIKKRLGLSKPWQWQEPEEWKFNIDVVSGCNLRCVACPVGMPEYSNSIGKSMNYMSEETFEQICIKALKDSRGKCNFGLYNWTEPTLHPHLDKLIGIANKHEIPCGISTNLNHDYQWSRLLDVRLSHMVITVSGLTQRTYQLNHKGGLIDKVIKNLVQVSRDLSSARWFKNIYIVYLVHEQNKDEYALFKVLADSLGIPIVPALAYYMPIEKVLDGISKSHDDLKYISYEPQKMQKALGHYRSSSCSLRDRQIALDSKANFFVCCGQSPSAAPLGNYLSADFQQMQSQRSESDLCAKCTKEGVNILMTYGSEETPSYQAALEAAAGFNRADFPSS